MANRYVAGSMWPLFSKGLELFPDNMDVVLDIVKGLKITEPDKQKTYFDRIFADPDKRKICEQLLEGEKNG
jgi:hypothetical protein